MKNLFKRIHDSLNEKCVFIESRYKRQTVLSVNHTMRRRLPSSLLYSFSELLIKQSFRLTYFTFVVLLCVAKKNRSRHRK